MTGGRFPAHPVLMANRPNPDGWEGGSEDFGFVRTLDGHLGQNVDDDPLFDRSNTRQGLDDANLSGSYRTGCGGDA